MTMEQLEQLEHRIVKALDLISDLRLENTQLESQIEEHKIDEQEKNEEIKHLKLELQEATEALQEIKTKEAELESKVVSILSRLENMKNKTTNIDMSDNSTPIMERAKSMSDNSHQTDLDNTPTLPQSDFEEKALDEKTEVPHVVPILDEIGNIEEDTLESLEDTNIDISEIDLDITGTSSTDESKDDNDMLLLDDQIDTPLPDASTQKHSKQDEEKVEHHEKNNLDSDLADQDNSHEILNVFHDDDDFLIVDDEADEDNPTTANTLHGHSKV